jgi:hypothetical protein
MLIILNSCVYTCSIVSSCVNHHCFILLWNIFIFVGVSLKNFHKQKTEEHHQSKMSSKLQEKQLQHMERMQQLEKKKPVRSKARDVDVTSITTTSRGAPAASSNTDADEPKRRGRGRPSKASVLSKHMKTIIDYLKEIEKPITFNDIINTNQIQLELHQLRSLFADLKKNPKVRFDWDSTKNSVDQVEDEVTLAMRQGLFEYKPTHQVRNIEDIITLLRDPDYRGIGVDEKELKDSYKTIASDIEQLIKTGRVYHVKNMEKKSNLLYYRDPAYNIPVDQKLKDLWNDITPKIPLQAHDLDAAVRKVKEVPLETYDLPTELKRKADEEAERKVQKKKRKSTIRKYTNAHLMDQINEINAKKNGA